MNNKQLFSLILLAVFCLRFLSAFDFHDHRSDTERCIQEHADHRHNYTSCEITDVLGANFQGHCSDKNHIKQEKEHCHGCGFDFVKYFEGHLHLQLPLLKKTSSLIAFHQYDAFDGVTLLLYNKGPPDYT